MCQLTREQLAANIAGLTRIHADQPELTPASVAVCVMTAGQDQTLLITRRARGLRRHPGQWALPGGKRDPGESVTEAALRELREETGLELTGDAVLGLLDDYVTRSGYVMTPVVVWGGPPPADLRGPASEVAQVFQIPLADLDVEPEFVRIPESDSPVIRIPFFSRHLHAPTAAIVYQFCQLALHATTCRVAHYEQPVFAWR